MSRQKHRRWLTVALATLAFLGSLWGSPAASLQSRDMVLQPSSHHPWRLSKPLPQAPGLIQTDNPLLAPAIASPASPSSPQVLTQNITSASELPATTLPDPLQQAHILNEQAIQQFSQGQAEAAISTWQAAQQRYEQAGDILGSLGTQINQAQVLQTLGLYRRARSLMDSIRDQLDSQPESEITVLGYQSLGGILQTTGYLEESKEMLQRSLAIAERQALNPTPTLITLGNTYRALQDIEAAQQSYHRAATFAEDPLSRVEAQLNLLSSWVGLQTVDPSQPMAAAESVLQAIEPQLQSLEPSRRSLFAQVNLGASLMQSLQASPRHALASAHQIVQILTRAAEQAHDLGDERAESFALGELGHLYEQNHQWNDAQQLTQQALHLAQNVPDIAYRWQWQTGRLLVASQRRQRRGLPESSRQQAIAAYQDAITTLRSIRGDLVATNLDVQFSFRESIEPIYREMVSLLIQPNSDADTLKHARDVIEELQLAELENFFRSACFDVSRQNIDAIDSQAAVIYPILLPDRLEILLSLPDQPLTHHTVYESQEKIEQSLDRWLQTLSPIYSNRQQRQQAQQIYDWLVRPIRPILESQDIQTLVFVPDGTLRNLPMAALHDGKQYLIENYQVALTPGLQLLEPRELVPGQLQTLSVGLTQARQGFEALPGVRQEIEQIQANVPAKIVLDEQFTKSNLKEQLQNSRYPIVHLATHGQFSSDPEQTFLLTWNDTIQVRDIRTLLRFRSQQQQQPIELLVLSACQTAAGDRQAALGLAGLAVQSGARSTLATLWSVNDRSTALLMTELYKQLSKNRDSTQSQISRGASLREAQMALLKSPQYSHPFYWSPFVLVGNWL